MLVQPEVGYQSATARCFLPVNKISKIGLRKYWICLGWSWNGCPGYFLQFICSEYNCAAHVLQIMKLVHGLRKMEETYGLRLQRIPYRRWFYFSWRWQPECFSASPLLCCILTKHTAVKIEKITSIEVHVWKFSVCLLTYSHLKNWRI